MSANVLSKLEIDLLIQLAVLGPMEASNWRPLTDDPDHIGRQLWAVNLDHVGDPERATEDSSTYVYQPLPLAITAAEGLKHVAYFLYQSGDPRDHRDGDECGDLLERLSQMLPMLIPEVGEAPWGWDARELERRRDRPPAVAVVEAAPDEDPRVTEFLEAWSVTSIPLARNGVTPAQALDNNSLQSLDPRLCLGSWQIAINFEFFTPTDVLLFESDLAASRAFAYLVMAYQGSPDSVDTIYRFGSSVVFTRFTDMTPTSVEPYLREMLAGLQKQATELGDALQHLGEPDEMWSNQDPPLREVEAEVVATHIRMSPFVSRSADERGFVASTPKKLSLLAEMVEDPALAAEILSTDTRRHTLTLLRRIPSIGGITSARVVQVIEQDHQGEPRLGDGLVLEAEDATAVSSTLVRTDRLSRTPSSVRIVAPRFGARIYAENAKPLK